MAGNDMAEIYITDIFLAGRYGVNRATPWRWAKYRADFPKPVSLSPGCTRWRLSEIEAWEVAKSSGKRP
jgi:prophage regulatory protein